MVVAHFNPSHTICKYTYLTYLSYLDLWHLLIILSHHYIHIWSQTHSCIIAIWYKFCELFNFFQFQPFTEHTEINISHIFQLCGLKGSRNNTFLPSVTHMKPNPCCTIAIWYKFCEFCLIISHFNPSLNIYMQINISHIFELCWLKVSSNNTFPPSVSHIKPNPGCTIAIWYSFDNRF